MADLRENTRRYSIMNLTSYYCQYVRWPYQLKRCADVGVEFWTRFESSFTVFAFAAVCCGADRESDHVPGEERVLGYFGSSESIRLHTELHAVFKAA
jgi:hypothetical protein